MADDVATFAGGCFWCLDSAFRRVRGVGSVSSGYCGGQTDSPSYDAVCSGNTGHAEAIKITFDAAIVDFRTLLTLFFSLHDPTTLNRQGADTGTQYRSAIFFHTEQQKKESLAMIDELDKSGVWSSPIVTELAPAATFYPAEKYHQDYYNNNKENRYCQMVISPKLSTFSSSFAGLLSTVDQP